MSDSHHALVQAMGEVRDLRSMQSCARRLAKLDPPADVPACSVWLLSNISTAFIADGLRQAMLVRGIWAEISEAGYDQWELAARDPGAYVRAGRPSIVLLILSSLGLAYSGPREPEAVAAQIVGAIRSLRDQGATQLLLTLPDPLEEERSVACWAHSWRRTLTRLLQEQLDGLATLVDLEPLVREVGAADWYATRYYVSAKLPFHPDCTPRFAAYLADLLCCAIRSRCKLVVTDLDNTLWGGVVGEVGPQGVDLDAGGEGLAHLRLQRFLKGLTARGILLAISSKNDPEVVQAVFEQRPEMILELADFSACEIGWGPKSGAVARILSSLNLSESAVLFIDDSPFEREEVARALPDVIVPPLPEDVLQWVPDLLATGRFERSAISDEDRLRKQFYQTEQERRTVRENVGDYAAFLESMSLRLRPIEATERSQRFADLLQRTNQFHMTGRRHAWAEVARLLSEGGLAFGYELEDRFGAYGMISAILLVPDGPDCFRIDSWALSCRAIGRTVEYAILDHLLGVVRQRGTISRIIGEFIPSPRNGPAKAVFESFGFRRLKQDNDRMLWELSLPRSSSTARCHYVRLCDGPTPVRHGTS